MGDRLNTDMVGARVAGFPGLHVLTGVSTARDVILAQPTERPSFLHTDLRGLTQAHPRPTTVQDPEGTWWQVGDQRARVTDGRLELAGAGMLTKATTVSLDAYRALVAAAWEAADADASTAPAARPAPGSQPSRPPARELLTVPEIEVAAP